MLEVRGLITHHELPSLGVYDQTTLDVTFHKTPCFCPQTCLLPIKLGNTSSMFFIKNLIYSLCSGSFSFSPNWINTIFQESNSHEYIWKRFTHIPVGVIWDLNGEIGPQSRTLWTAASGRRTPQSRAPWTWTACGQGNWVLGNDVWAKGGQELFIYLYYEDAACLLCIRRCRTT